MIHTSRGCEPRARGGAIGIQAACNVWKANVNVDNCRDKNGKTINFVPVTGNADKVFGIYWVGGHYEPILTRLILICSFLV